MTTTAQFKEKNFRNRTSEERSNIARLGGQTAHILGKAHKWTAEEARAAGRKGAQKRAENRAARLAIAPAKQGVLS